MKPWLLTLAPLAWIATAAAAQQAAPSGSSPLPGSMLYGRPVSVAPIPAAVLASDDERRQAAAVGARLAELRIPVTTLEASPFCRTRQTAEIAFGRAPIINGGLLYHITQTSEQVSAANRRLKARLAEPPPTGANIVLVGRSPTMKEASGVELPEGQAAIVKPSGDGTFRVVARLTEMGIMPVP